jgi:hypothetical protein
MRTVYGYLDFGYVSHCKPLKEDEEHAGAIACTIEFLGVDHVGITYITESIEARMPADPMF